MTKAAATLDALLVRATEALARGDVEAAEGAARAATLLDDGTKALEALAAVLMTGARWEAAEAVLGDALRRAPWQAALHVGRAQALGHLGRTAAMLRELATAVALDPDDAAPIEAAAQALANDAAARLGAAGAPPTAAEALAAAEGLAAQLGATATARGALVLDLARLRLAVARSAPAHAIRPIVGDVVVGARGLPATRRVAIATHLAALGQTDGVRALLADVAPEGLPPADRARAEQALGAAAEAEGRPAAALARYEAALAADPGRWQSGCEALRLLLTDASEGATDRMRRLLSSIDDRVRRAHPPLLFNEALYHARIGRREAARALLEEVRERVLADTPLARHAAEALAVLT